MNTLIRRPPPRVPGERQGGSQAARGALRASVRLSVLPGLSPASKQVLVPQDAPSACYILQMRRRMMSYRRRKMMIWGFPAWLSKKP